MKCLSKSFNNLFLTTAIAFSLTGISIIHPPQAMFAQTPSTLAPITLTEIDNGKTITLQKGDRLQITLPENPTTGFQWAIETKPKNLLSLEKSDYVASSPQLIGSGGQRTLTLLAKKTGKTYLNLKLWRSWEGDKSIVNRYQITLQIKP